MDMNGSRPEPLPMRVALAALAGVAALAFAVALSTRWQASAFAAGALTRTVITDTWTGRIVVCTTIHGTTPDIGRTACIPEARP